MKTTIPEPYRETTREIFNEKLGITFNGESNELPLIIENAIKLSPTAKQCTATYESFLLGSGFVENLEHINLNQTLWDEKTPNDLLADVCQSVAKHGGAFIHVGYNALLQKDSFKVLPYSLCRVGKKDSEEYAGKIVVSKKGWGKELKKEELITYDTYNPNSDVLEIQIERDGGIENYNGQIYFFKLSTEKTYPDYALETVLEFTETEYNIGLFYTATTNRGFEDITVWTHRAFDNQDDQRNFHQNITNLRGTKNASRDLIVEDEWDEDKNVPSNFRFTTLPNTATPEKYAHFEVGASNYIRRVFRIPPQLLDFVAGKLGNTSGEDLRVAEGIYNKITAKDRAKISRLFKELFRGYKNEVNPANNWEIGQYKLMDDTTVSQASTKVTHPNANQNQLPKESKEDQAAKDEIRKAQATIRGSVGGVEAVIKIQESVSLKTTTYDSAVAMLENIFGYSTELSQRMLGNPEIEN